MIREIITYPDKRLYQKSKEVNVFDEKLHTLLDDMYDTMISKNGIGLAAIQIAVPLKVVVINLLNEDGEQLRENTIEAINPKIITKEGSTTFEEGCLSVPGFYEIVQRAEIIEVLYQDRFANKIKRKMDALLAIAMQHEMDHLDGHLFIERISYLKRQKFQKAYKNKKRL